MLHACKKECEKRDPSESPQYDPPVSGVGKGSLSARALSDRLYDQVPVHALFFLISLRLSDVSHFDYRCADSAVLLSVFLLPVYAALEAAWAVAMEISLVFPSDGIRSLLARRPA